MTEQQKAYQERQKQYAEAKLVLEKTSDEVSAKCKADYEKDQATIKWALENKRSVVQASFPFLFDAQKNIADIALRYIGYNKYHDSLSITNHHDGVFNYRLVRERWEILRDENGNVIYDENGYFIKNGRKSGKWIAGASEVRGQPFPIELFNAVYDFGAIVICEGEKDAINLNLYGIPALTVGASTSSWSKCKEIITGHDVIIWHDNDKAGQEANENAYEALKDIASSIMIVDWKILDPNASKKDDATDYLLRAGNIGADALIKRLKNSRYVAGITKSWEEVSSLMLETLEPLHFERDEELGEMMKIFISALKNDKESNGYGKVMDRANLLVNKYPEKAEMVRISRLPAPSEFEKEQLAEYQKKSIKGVKILQEACEDAVLYEYFSKTFMGEMRKHVTSDVVLHWSDTFLKIGIDFVRLGNSYLFWCGTHYKEVTHTQFKNTFNRFLESARVNIKQRLNYGTFKRPAIDSIQDNAYFIDDVRGKWDDYAVINHQNGTIIIDSFGNIQHKAHDRSDYMTYALPYAYDENAKCKKFDKFLERVVPDESVRMVLQEYAGYLFLPKYLQNFLFLYGMGANGKSVFIKVLAALFDEDNVSYIEVQDMYDHNLDGLNGKKLNISSEISGNANQKGQVELLKKIAEGATITVNPKHERAYKIVNPPKMVMSGNEKLKGGGQNDGLIRRLMMIPFEVQIPKAERNMDLHQEIINEEMSGVLNWAIDGLLRLTKNRFKFTQSNILDSVMDEYREETDQVYLYIKETFAQYDGAYPDNDNLVRKVYEVPLIYSKNARISTKVIYMHYINWAKDSGVHEMKQQTFIAKLCEKLKTKAKNIRAKHLVVQHKFAGGESVMNYESKTGNVIEGFRITPDIKVNIGGMHVSVMETMQQGEAE